jgi:hypothetical protein
MTLEKNKPWAKAVSLAAYLHGCFRSTMSLALDVGSFGEKRNVLPETVPPPARLTQPNLI